MMIKSKHAFAIALGLLMTVCSGCMHYGRPYRSDYLRPDPPTQPCEEHPKDFSTKSIWCPGSQAPYYLAFIEVDDFGEFYDPGQLTRALRLIQYAKAHSSPTGNAKVITFIHGWKNNASDAAGNVWGFRDALKSLGDEYGGPGNDPIVGIYIGWRGAVTKLPVIKEFTFFNRKNAATRIAAANLTEAINQIINTTKECVKDCGAEAASTAEDINDCKAKPRSGPGSLAVVVGHSFGGMVLERTVTQGLVADILQQESDRKSCTRKEADWKMKKQEAAHDQEINACEQLKQRGIQPRADLIALVNEAAPATEARQLLGFMVRHNVRLKVDNEPVPLVLSITSVGDSATGVAFPIGQYPSKLTKALRHYKDTAPPDMPIPNQSTYYLHTTGHLPPLFSHLVGKPQDQSIRKVLDSLGPGAEEKYCYASNKVNSTQKYCVVPAPQAFNTTAYWVMQMPTEIVPDHSTIFRPVFIGLLRHFVAARVCAEAPSKPARPAFLNSKQPAAQIPE